MNRLEHTLDLGSAELFPLAREAILTWKLQESAGVIARPVRRAHVGQIVDLWLNPVWPRRAVRLRGRELSVPVGPCEVVEVIDTEVTDEERQFQRAAGFVYRTLPGHLESGEQTFLVTVSSDDRLRVTITSESVPGHPLLKAFAPLSVAAQKMMAARYATGLKRMLQRLPSPGPSSLHGRQHILGEGQHRIQ
ncbi:MAG: DUF1990 family protein [Brevibacterium aurantiacum]|uniref:DUF1990 domain-containing protein n=2 Tax=Brevibacterium TaxID=1696 RepID=A0A2A3YXP2_BREAU|nr:MULTISPECIES: DUF1990 family protein [Brevibacterium]SMX73972.1 Uncharacterized protein, UPF0548 family [Brevibacterium antiquum CNRZ 918]AZL08129.1 DUF1990 domain-containing protein [Brevibacterium aurantiacum]MDN5587432.1 DUF1990 domain-containing protein [Brevibacterium sp.]PCC44029.1 DUF1990 domain-containing protein [Brevibacterium aurantiacum]PCC45951.1 DUF1990 domain-containing protein [Brevibacterium aurantiacum]